MDSHRKVFPKDLETHFLKPPFSFFELIESKFGDYNSIRRIFSLARSFTPETLIIEHIDPTGIIAEENEDILARFPDYQNKELLRISFWKKPVIKNELATLKNDDLIGYAILKLDCIPSLSFYHWHVFESIFVKYDHEHNCCPHPGLYHFTVGDESFEINGLLYCQQNTLNKACAQVALRSLLSRILPEGDISYRRINQIADTVTPGFDPGKGLNVQQLRKIFIELDIRFNDIDYSIIDKQDALSLPYQKYAYAGLESGSGALIGFRLAGPALPDDAKHIIPFYGHTFNKDTWVPDADISYFHIGDGVGYIPSESWTSSFIGHDDNFGPNFCIPRLYIEKDKVDYVVELFRKGVCYSGMEAEAVALNILYSILPNLNERANKNPWIKRLAPWTHNQKIVFRAQAVSSSEYVNHLRSLIDWEGKTENIELCEFLEKETPSFLWAVEISMPHLFPANERKLGEIVLDATQELNIDDDSAIFDIFILARLPEIYLFGGDLQNGTPQFNLLKSNIKSHTELMKLV